jgi:hypothetical protein
MVFSLPLNANVLFCWIFLNVTRVRPNSGFFCCVFLTFTDNSINSVEIHLQVSYNNRHPVDGGLYWLLVHSRPANMKEYSVQWVRPLYCHHYGTRCRCTHSQLMTHVNWKSCFMVVWQRHSTRHSSFLLPMKFCPSTLCFFILNPLSSPCLFSLYPK